jgi:signal transduction histidine kinase
MDPNKVDILLVDDRPEQRMSISAVLAELGDNVVEASSGREALRQLLRREFAVILLDVHMPVMDGFETAALIRQRHENERTPIIFVTAFADDNHAARGYSLGAVDYIQSPVDPDVLKTKVGVFVELFRKSSELKRQARALAQHAAQLHALTEASLAIQSAPSIDDALRIVTERAAAIVEAEQAVTRLAIPEDHGANRAKSWIGHGSANSGQSATDEEVCVRAPVFVEGRPIRLAQDELERHPAWRSRRGSDLPMRGWLAAPLRTRDGKTIGSIQVSEKREGTFSADDEAVLVALAQMSSIAIENTLFGEAREANRLKDEFLGTLSHELRTPLQSMFAWLKLLRLPTADPQTVARGLDVIERSAKAQGQLIEDILDVSRIITGKLRLERHALDLGRIVAAAVDAIRPAAAERGIELRILPTSAQATVAGDAVRIQQVLGNLLSNGVKFTPPGGRVEVRLRVADGCAEIAVRDNGSGIDPELMPRIFERFRQSDSSTTRRHGGLGLGLAIVRHLVELHGGRVAAESDGVGHGATFTVTLPLAPSAAAALAKPPPPPLKPPARSESAGGKLEGISILLAEDDRDTRESFVLVLELHGANVAAVESAAAALAEIEKQAPDVLVSDIGMPGEDGYALIREVRLREAGTGRRVPAIALTAYVRTEDRVRSLLAGFDAHIDKPIEPDAFAEVVRSLVQRTASVTAAVQAPGATSGVPAAQRGS